MNRLLHVGNSKELRSLKLKVHITRSIWDCGGSYQKTCRSYRSREFGEMEMCFQLNDTARDQARDEILKFLNRVLIK